MPRPAPEPILDSAPPGYVLAEEVARLCRFNSPEWASETLIKASIPSALVHGRNRLGHARVRRYFDPAAALRHFGTDPVARAAHVRKMRADALRGASAEREHAWRTAAQAVQAERAAAERERDERERLRAVRRAECPVLERLAAERLRAAGADGESAPC